MARGLRFLRASCVEAGTQVVAGNTYEARDEGVTVYNFEVEGGHTYFVADDQGDVSAVWVHNDCRRLGRQLSGRSNRAAQTMRRLGYEAHHIVSENHRGAAALRNQLSRFGVPLDSRVNGVWLGGPTMGGPHRGIHTPVYFGALEDRLINLNSRRSIVRELKAIGLEIQNGTFPH